MSGRRQYSLDLTAPVLLSSLGKDRVIIDGPSPTRTPEVAVGISDLMVLEEMVRLTGLAALISQWKIGTNMSRPGRPSTVRPVDALLLRFATRIFKTERNAERQLAKDAKNWVRLRDAFREAHPTDPDMWPSVKPPSRSAYRRFCRRLKDVGLDEHLDKLLSEFRVTALGRVLETSTQPFANPKPGNVLYGDSTVMKAASKFEPGDVRLDYATGELRPRRYDPSARRHSIKRTDDHGVDVEVDTKLYGVPTVIVAQRNRAGLERIPFAEAAVPKGKSDAEVFVDLVLQLQPRLSHVSIAAFDGALQGSQAHRLIEAGIIPMNYLHTKNDGELDTANLGPHKLTLSSGGEEEVALFTIDGHAGMLVTSGGEEWWVPLTRKQIRPGYKTMYLESVVPNHPVVSRRMRGARMRIRLSSTADELGRGINRAQHLRAFPPQDPVFGEIYGLREDVESINNQLKKDCWNYARFRTYQLSENLRDVMLWSVVQTLHAIRSHAKRTAQHDPPLPLVA